MAGQSGLRGRLSLLAQAGALPTAATKPAQAPDDERGSKTPLNRVNRITSSRRDQPRCRHRRAESNTVQINAGASPRLHRQGWWLSAPGSAEQRGWGARGDASSGLLVALGLIHTQGALQGAVWTWVKCKSLLKTLPCINKGGNGLSEVLLGAKPEPCAPGLHHPTNSSLSFPLAEESRDQ